MARGCQENDIHSSLYLWSAKEVPTQWKWKWLCLKPKIDSGIPTARDLRPLCLLDCLKKLWERLILRRITSVWDTHNILNEAQNCRSGRGFSAALFHFQAVIVGCTEGVRLNVQNWHQTSMDETWTSGPHIWLPHINRQRRKNTDTDSGSIRSMTKEDEERDTTGGRWEFTTAIQGGERGQPRSGA